MTAVKVTMPVCNFDYQDFQDKAEDYGHTEIGRKRKDWCRPSAMSMVKLNQVHANMYNMEFKDANSLKPPISTKRLMKQQQSEGPTFSPQAYTSGRNDGKNEVVTSFRDPETNPTTVSSYQKSAWGSSNSIPEMLVKHGNLNKLRPSSAKVQTSPWPSGNNRPQSAKDPLTDEQDRRHISGKKKDVNSRVALRFTMGNAPLANSNQNRQASSGKSGKAPAECTYMKSYKTDQGHKSFSKTKSDSLLVVPCTSPVTSDVEEEISRQQSSQMYSHPVLEPIHLPLSHADEEDYENIDASDTDRLLQKADTFLQQKSSEEELLTENLLSCKTVLQDSATNHASISSSPCIPDMSKDWLSQTDTYVSLSSISKKSPHKKCDDDVLVPKLCISNITLASDSSDNIALEAYEAFNSYGERGSWKGALSSDSNISLGLKIEGPAQSEQASHFKNQESLETMKQNSANELPLPDDGNNFYDPFQVTSQQIKPKTTPPTHVRSNVKIREDKNITVDITPRNLGKKVENFSALLSAKKISSQNNPALNNSYKYSMRHFNKNDQTCNRKATNNHVTVVSLNYDDDYEGDMKDKKSKKAVPEVETMISRLSEEEFESNTPCNFILSSGEKNYYEVAHTAARSQSRPVSTRMQDTETDIQQTTIYKTTKTIEFNTRAPVEIVYKNVISAAHRAKSLNFQSSTIKVQQKKEKKKSAESAYNEMVTKSVDELVDIVYGAKSFNRKERQNSERKKCKPPKTTPESAFKAWETFAAEDLVHREKTVIKSKAAAVPKFKVHPFSAGAKATSSTRSKALHKDKSTRRFSMYATSLQPSKPSTKPRRIKSAIIAERGKSDTKKESKVNLKTRRRMSLETESQIALKTVSPMEKSDSSEKEECKAMQFKMAALGVDVNLRALERALFPPSRKSIPSHQEGQLPSDPCYGLLPHYKHWVPEEYEKLQMITQRLAKDDQIRQKQKMKEEKRMKNLGRKLLNRGSSKIMSQQVRRNSVM